MQGGKGHKKAGNYRPANLLCNGTQTMVVPRLLLFITTFLKHPAKIASGCPRTVLELEAGSSHCLKELLLRNIGRRIQTFDSGINFIGREPMGGMTSVRSRTIGCLQSSYIDADIGDFCSWLSMINRFFKRWYMLCKITKVTHNTETILLWV